MKRTITSIIFTLIACTSQADIYKCLGDPEVEPDDVTYQDEPCYKKSKAHRLEDMNLLPAVTNTYDSKEIRRLEVLRLKGLVRQEERQLDRIYLQSRNKLYKAINQDTDNDGMSDNFYSQSDLKTAVERLDDEERLTSLAGVKLLNKNRIERQQFKIARLMRQLKEAEAQLE